jgi:DnaJ-class molecular chaperone
MPRELTAENGAKAALMGDFSEIITLQCHECDGTGYYDHDTHENSGNYENVCEHCIGAGTYGHNVQLSWITIKAIYAKAVEVCEISGIEEETA